MMNKIQTKINRFEGLIFYLKAIATARHTTPTYGIEQSTNERQKMATMGMPRPSELKTLLAFVRVRMLPLMSLSLTAPKTTVTMAQAK